ncbi:hypothetical protein E4K10_49895 [Streptomyces sp. T1317-0309]|nr:hypothetical protein E4K10_49895 [Streptomyces sp. T1317-0309]
MAAFDKKAAGRTGQTYWQSSTGTRPASTSPRPRSRSIRTWSGTRWCRGSPRGPGRGRRVVDSGAAVASSVGDMAQVVTGAWNLLTNPSIWMRAGYGTLGLVLVAGGLFLIVRNQPAVQKAAKQVASAVPAGRALKGA